MIMHLGLLSMYHLFTGWRFHFSPISALCSIATVSTVSPVKLTRGPVKFFLPSTIHWKTEMIRMIANAAIQ